MKGFNFKVLKRFWAIAQPYWLSEEKWRASGLVFLLLLVLVASSVINVFRNFLRGDIVSSLATQDGEKFLQTVALYVAVMIVAVPLFASDDYLQGKIALYWRRWMTNRFLALYFNNRAYYKISSIAEIDNPDQRLAEDIKTFTEQSINFLVKFIKAILQLLAFSGVLWSISKPLVIFLFIYAIAATFVTAGVFGKILIVLNFNQLKREANFRFGLIRIRENAESIAFYQGEEREANYIQQRFQEVLSNFDRLIRWHLNLNLFKNSYEYITFILPAVIVGPQVLAGQVKIGVFTQAREAFLTVFNSLQVIIDQFDKLTNFAAGITRLEEFETYLEGTTNTPITDSFGEAEHARTIDSVEDSRLALKHITLLTPNYKRTLVRDLSLAVPRGEGLLIVGTSGGGKSSLLRAIAGLWNAGTGAVVRPKLEEILFLPQRPYMILGSLRDQLLYPHHPRDISNEELYQVLAEVNLPKLAERFGGFDAQEDWAHVLSLGEQLRLAFARLLVTKPRYAILDESTSALDIKNEAKLYQHILATSTTFVSVGHRPTLVKYHHQVLELAGNENWRVMPAEKYIFSEG